MKHKKVLIFSLPLLTMLILGCFEVKDEDLIKDYASTTKNNNVVIGNAGVKIPLGYYGLLKRGNKICAVKFIESGEKKDILREKEFFKWSYEYSTYEWYSTNDGKSFLNNSTKHGTGKSTWKYIAVPFLGPHGFLLNDCDIDCEYIKIKRNGCRTLTFITGDIFYKNKKDIENEGFEIAPTKWKNIKEVNLTDTRLKWYRCEPNRIFDVVPVDELW